jgi:hypothetical protein
MTSVSTVACRQCGIEFAPRRSTATYCSPRCRAKSHRRIPLTANTEPQDAYANAEDTQSAQAAFSDNSRTLRLPKGIVPDAKYPGMYRLLLPGGGLSDVVNLTRAKDALRALAERNQRAM